MCDLTDDLSEAYTMCTNYSVHKPEHDEFV